MPRILQLHTHYREPGGEDIAAESDRRCLEEAGHEVVSFRATNSYGLRAARQLASYSWNPLVVRRVLDLAERVRPDIAHLHNSWFALPPDVLPALRRVGIPTVVTLHNYRLTCANAMLLRDGQACELCIDSSIWNGVRFGCYRESRVASVAAVANMSVLRKKGTWHDGVDRFLALTEFAKGRLVRSGIRPEKVTVRSNFVWDSEPRESPPSASRTVAYVGRLSQEKGLDVAIDAWVRAKPDGLRLVVVGDGPERAALMSRADDSVSFLGRIPHKDVEEILLKSRVVIVPSIWYEAQPLGILEAFACGVPVLGSDIGGIAETIAPLGSSWRVPAGDVPAWTERLAGLSDSESVDRAGKKARTAYEDVHSPNVARVALEAVYREVYDARDDGPPGQNPFRLFETS